MDDTVLCWIGPKRTDRVVLYLPGTSFPSFFPRQMKMSIIILFFKYRGRICNSRDTVPTLLLALHSARVDKERQLPSWFCRSYLLYVPTLLSSTTFQSKSQHRQPLFRPQSFQSRLDKLVLHWSTSLHQVFIQAIFTSYPNLQDPISSWLLYLIYFIHLTPFVKQCLCRLRSEEST